MIGNITSNIPDEKRLKHLKIHILYSFGIYTKYKSFKMFINLSQINPEENITFHKTESSKDIKTNNGTSNGKPMEGASKISRSIPNQIMFFNNYLIEAWRN